MDKILSVIIVNYNTVEMTKECISSLMSFNKSNNFEIIIFDNNSTDNSIVEFEKCFPEVKVIASEKNIGFGQGNNKAVEYAEGELILLLNSDTITIEPFIDELISTLKSSEEIGVVGLKLKNQDFTNQISYGYFPSSIQVLSEFFRLHKISEIDGIVRPLGSANFNFKKNKIVDYVSGACLLIRKKDFLDISGFDPQYFMYFEEVDLCLRVKKKLNKISVVKHNSFLVHLGGGSFNEYSIKRISWFYESFTKFLSENYSKSSKKKILILHLLLNIFKRMISTNKGRQKYYNVGINVIRKGLK